jgi:hypothetical protein
MLSLEIVVIESAAEAIHVAFSGVYNFAIDNTECDNCGMLTGPVAGDFFPCALAACIDEESDAELPTVLCLDCIGAVLWPGEAATLDEDDY